MAALVGRFFASGRSDFVNVKFLRRYFPHCKRQRPPFRRIETGADYAIHQNLALAFCYNALAIPVAAGILYPFTGWLLSPVLAGAAMAMSSVSVVGNALRLRRGI